MGKKILKIEKTSTWLLYIIVVLPLIAASLMYFKVVNIMPYIPDVITIFAAGFISNEIVKRLGKRLKKSPWGMFGLIVAFVAVVAAVLSLIGVTVAIFDTIQGIVVALVALYVIIEGIK